MGSSTLNTSRGCITQLELVYFSYAADTLPSKKRHLHTINMEQCLKKWQERVRAAGLSFVSGTSWTQTKLGKVNTFLIWGVTKDVIHLPSIFFVLCALTTSCKELSRIPLKASRTQCGSRRPCDLPQEVPSKRQHSLVSTLSQIEDYFANLVSRHKWRIHVPCVPLPKLSCRRLPASMPRTRQHERLEESEVKGADMALT